jgi:hypothetical protein
MDGEEIGVARLVGIADLVAEGKNDVRPGGNK